MKSIGIQPDGMIGHSAGEVASAYADGCATAEQAVLSAFWRGRSLVETQLKPGAMAAIGKVSSRFRIIYIHENIIVHISEFCA